MTLEARELVFSYDEHRVLDGVSLSLAAGELVGLVGPNGAGKTTLLHLLLGLLRPDGGTVAIDGVGPERMSRRGIAQRAALVPQQQPSEFAFTVRELVAMGRTPHLGRFEPERPQDAEAVRLALEATETEALAARWVAELSGGERQRVHLARAIAQETPMLLLDEPTANLDVAHQLTMLDLVRRQVQGGKSAILALHDLSLAARYSDRLLLLAERRIVASGAPRAVITEDNLARYFRIRARLEHDGTGGLVVVPLAPVDLPPSIDAGARAGVEPPLMK
jgi:iron complex transport system ATP-binding protein